MVETPGTAPGSDPLITSAFMSIVPKDTTDIGPKRSVHKGARYAGDAPGHATVRLALMGERRAKV